MTKNTRKSAKYLKSKTEYLAAYGGKNHNRRTNNKRGGIKYPTPSMGFLIPNYGGIVAFVSCSYLNKHIGNCSENKKNAKV